MRLVFALVLASACVGSTDSKGRPTTPSAQGQNNIEAIAQGQPARMSAAIIALDQAKIFPSGDEPMSELEYFLFRKQNHDAVVKIFGAWNSLTPEARLVLGRAHDSDPTFATAFSHGNPRHELRWGLLQLVAIDATLPFNDRRAAAAQMRLIDRAGADAKIGPLQELRDDAQLAPAWIRSEDPFQLSFAVAYYTTQERCPTFRQGMADAALANHVSGHAKALSDDALASLYNCIGRDATPAASLVAGAVVSRASLRDMKKFVAPIYVKDPAASPEALEAIALDAEQPDDVRRTAAMIRLIPESKTPAALASLKGAKILPIRIEIGEALESQTPEAAAAAVSTLLAPPIDCTRLRDATTAAAQRPAAKMRALLPAEVKAGLDLVDAMGKLDDRIQKRTAGKLDPIRAAYDGANGDAQVTAKAIADAEAAIGGSIRDLRAEAERTRNGTNTRLAAGPWKDSVTACLSVGFKTSFVLFATPPAK